MKEVLIDAAVQLLTTRGVTGVTADGICTAAGVLRAEFDEHFSCSEAAYAAVVARLVILHRSARICAEVGRSRSLRDVLTRMTRSFVNILGRFPAEHQAVLCLRVAEIGNPRLITDVWPHLSVHNRLSQECQTWLTEVERTQDIVWTLPLPELVAIHLGALQGLVLDYLLTQNRQAADSRAQIVACHLATFGRRRLKGAIR